MDKKQEVTVKGGVGFVGLLTIVLIALKLMGYIKWSWVWVLSPIWICALIGIGAMIAIFLILASLSK